LGGCAGAGRLTPCWGSGRERIVPERRSGLDYRVAEFSLKEVLTMKRASILALCGVALLALVVVPTLSSAASAEKPRIAVLEFKNKADNQWWYHGGAQA